MKRTALVLFALAAVAAAQQNVTAPAPKKPAAPAPTPIKWHGITVTGSIRSRVEAWDWFKPDAGDNSYPFSGNILKVGFSQNRETWDWNAEFALPALLGLPTNPVGPGTQGALGFGANYLTANNRDQNTAMLFPRQLYVRFTQFGNSKAHALKLGRFEFSDGSEVTPQNPTLAALKRDRINQRLIGPFGFTHVGRSFDGVHYSMNKGAGNFTFVGAIPTRGAFQVDGWGWNQTAFGYASYTRTYTNQHYSNETRVFALYYDDWRDVLKVDNRPLPARRSDLANIKITTWGGHSLHAYDTNAGTADLLLWGAYQAGKWGVQDHRAFAYDVEAGFQPKVLPKLKPWLRGGFYSGSGDGNPNDKVHETFFQVLPTPRPFARFPFFNMMNNRDVMGILILRPHPKVTLSSEFHALALSDANDLWYSGGGVFQPWTFGYAGRASSGRKSLANLYDTGVEYRWNPKTTFAGYIGFAQGRAVTSYIYPKGANGTYSYVEASYRF
ncbi:MAG TPA: alginate export family protein [Bryobacteraceae bacterium]|nr:alginate export family protein [Bryobacteraceae bacterium]